MQDPAISMRIGAVRVHPGSDGARFPRSKRGPERSARTRSWALGEAKEALLVTPDPNNPTRGPRAPYEPTKPQGGADRADNLNNVNNNRWV